MCLDNLDSSPPEKNIVSGLFCSLSLEFACLADWQRVWIIWIVRLSGTIQQLMGAGGTLEELKSKQKAYDEVWRKFVGTHEEYVECLEVLEYEEELKQARISYQQQMERKLTFDSKIKSWELEAMERELYSRKATRSRSHSSRSFGSSSVSLALAKKKEQLALAQLKTKQVLREQELKRKMSELQYAKEIMEAQMEEGRQ